MPSARLILHILDKAEGYMSQMLLVTFICIIFLQTVLRSCFSIVLPWSEEASRFAFVWFVFLGASYATRLAAHNRVVLQFALFPQWFGKYSMLLMDVIWIIFNCIMVKESLVIIQDLRDFPYMSPGMEISMEYVYMIFPLAFTLMSIRIIQVNYIKFILKQEIKDMDKIEAEDYEDLASSDKTTIKEGKN